MKYIISITLLFLFASAKGQPVLATDSVRHNKKGDIVKVKGYYSGYGKLFGNSNDYMLDHLNVDHYFLPTDQDILLAEQLMQSGFPELVKSDPRMRTMPDDYRKFYYDWYRQYCGVISKSGERFIFLMLIDCCGHMKKCFPTWKEELQSPLREDPCAKIAWYDVNLTARRIIMN